jgi:glutamyl-tRNA reductase
MAEAIIKDIKEDFEVWVEYRKFAPTIKALKEKLKVFADVEIKNQRKKNAGFNYDQADLISSNIVQKITNHFAHHLKEETVSPKESLALIHKIFQLEA